MHRSINIAAIVDFRPLDSQANDQAAYIVVDSFQDLVDQDISPY